MAIEPSLDADLVILGGGCAGLSLAARLATQCPALQVCVIEPRTEYVEDRTWCGWRTSPHPYVSCVAANWPEWRVIDGTRTVTRGSVLLPYEMIPADRFYDLSLAMIRATSTVCLHLGTTADLVSEDAGGVSTRLGDGRTLRSKWVIDTRPQTKGRSFPALWQNFVGYEISADERWTELLGTTPILMDLQPSGSAAVQFMYVIPLGANRFLCEWTRFSAVHGEEQAIEKDLILWLQQRGCTAAMMGRREAGSLPMSVTPSSAPGSSRVFRAGTAGGSMRASTGYAFHAIQRWADRCTASLAAGGPPLEPSRSRCLDFLDEVFLTALQTRPSRGAAIFMNLFERTSAERLVRFLSGIPRATDILPVMASLPWLLFSNAALKTLRQKLADR